MRCAAAFLALWAAQSALAENLEPGRWRVVTTMLSGPPSPPQVATRCLTPEQVADPGKTFAPQASTVNSDCERTVFKLEPSGLTWQLQCRGQVDMDVTGQFIFDSTKRYNALVTTKVTMLDRLVQETMISIAAEHVGDCR